MTETLGAARDAAKLTDEQRRVMTDAAMLVDGRVLVPAYSVPDHLTRCYSVQRSALNRAGLAVRAILLREQG